MSDCFDDALGGSAQKPFHEVLSEYAQTLTSGARLERSRFMVAITFVVVAAYAGTPVAKLTDPVTHTERRWRGFAVHACHTVLGVSMHQIAQVTGMAKATVFGLVKSAEDRTDSQRVSEDYEKVRDQLDLIKLGFGLG